MRAAPSPTRPTEKRRQAPAPGPVARAREDHFDRSKQPSEQARRVLQRGSALAGQSLRQGGESLQPSPGPPGRLRPQRPVHGHACLQNAATWPAAAPQQLAAARGARRPAPRESADGSPALGSPGPRSSPPPTPRPAPTHPTHSGTPSRPSRPLTCLMYMAPRPSAGGRRRLSTAAARPAAGSGDVQTARSRSLPCGRTKWRRPRRRSPRVGRNHDGSDADRRGGGEAGPALSRRKGHSPAALLGGLDLVTAFSAVLITENPLGARLGGAPLQRPAGSTSGRSDYGRAQEGRGPLGAKAWRGTRGANRRARRRSRGRRAA